MTCQSASRDRLPGVKLLKLWSFWKPPSTAPYAGSLCKALQIILKLWASWPSDSTDPKPLACYHKQAEDPQHWLNILNLSLCIICLTMFDSLTSDTVQVENPLGFAISRPFSLHMLPPSHHGRQLHSWPAWAGSYAQKRAKTHPRSFLSAGHGQPISNECLSHWRTTIWCKYIY